MIKALKIPDDNDDGPYWRNVTIIVEEAHGPTGKKLLEEYHEQHTVQRNKIYWRKKGSEHTFIFSPQAAIEAKDSSQLPCFGV
jgi:hypothetical protein